MKFPSIRKEYALFELASPWYGHVYSPMNRPYLGVSYLIPFNVPLRVGYLLWLWCQCPFRHSEPAWWVAKFKAKNYPNWITDTNTITGNDPAGKVTHGSQT